MKFYLRFRICRARWRRRRRPLRATPKTLDPYGRAYATGKRKDAVARVWIKPGPGKVNGRPLDHYFARPVLRMILQQPLAVAKRADQYDLTISVASGGLSGMISLWASASVSWQDDT